jgi:hypothetical protein
MQERRASSHAAIYLKIAASGVPPRRDVEENAFAGFARFALL